MIRNLRGKRSQTDTSVLSLLKLDFHSVERNDLMYCLFDWLARPPIALVYDICRPIIFFFPLLKGNRKQASLSATRVRVSDYQADRCGAI